MARSVLLVLAIACPALAMRVLVTGAGGRTGKLVFEQLKAEAAFTPVGLARSKKAFKALRKVGAADDEIVRADATRFEELTAAMDGCGGVVLCTSAVPKIRPLSILKLLVKKSILRSKDPGRPLFRFVSGGTPEEIDWIGAKLQVDAAKAAGVKHFVFVSSMGGTQPENFLNSIGRQRDGSGGDILLWKRKAERYLIESGLRYTIVHPGGLVDEPATEGALVVDVDDKLLERKSRQVPRADVARVCCAALREPAARNKSFDLASNAKGEGEPTVEAGTVFEQLGERSCDYSTVLPDPPSIFAK